MPIAAFEPLAAGGASANNSTQSQFHARCHYLTFKMNVKARDGEFIIAQLCLGFRFVGQAIR